MLPAFSPQDFVSKWRQVDLSERSAVQQHFLDLCRLVGQPPPAEADPTGHDFAFEMGAAKTEGGQGWPADLSDDDILARLLALNLERAAAQGAAAPGPAPDDEPADDAEP